ncbi:MAG TPA: ribonuclease E/G, partial [Rhodopila sp.]|nr:ribonuclease E/G [Rhodopila sp.]
RERNIEETALRTNLEAADEIARQLRLRDLAGLIVIDFIDMESKRHNAMVERRLKEALKNDRARIQVGHISHFGLLEMSRQRLRPSLAETSFIVCPHCGGTGHVRSTESSAIHVLRGIEDEGAKRRSAEIVVHVSTPVALYLLNHKRERLREIELRYAMRVIVAADDTQIAPQYRIEKVRTRSPDEVPPVVTPDRPVITTSPFEAELEDEEDIEGAGADDEDEDTEEEAPDDARGAETADASAEDTERRRKRRRRRRRGGRRDEQPTAAEPRGDEETEPATAAEPAAGAEAPADAEAEEAFAAESDSAGGDSGGGEEAPDSPPFSDEDGRSRRRGRRGGRRRRRENEGELAPFAVPGAEQPDLRPAYAGPTPADPFGGQVFDIFDVMERAEREAEVQPLRRTASAADIVNAPLPEPGSAAPVAPPAAANPSSANTPAAAPQAEITNAPGPEPAGELPAAETAPTQAAEPAAAEASAPDAAAAETTPEAAAEAEPPPPEPAIKPIVIGASNEPPVEKKRGWWRR